MTVEATGAPPRSTARHRLTASGTVVLLLVGIALPATFTGSGPMASAAAILVVLALIVLLVVGVTWPTLAIRSFSVAASAPPDATVGDRVRLTVRTGGGLAGAEIRILDPVGPWQRAVDGVEVAVDHRADRRGVFSMLRCEVRTTVPLGLFSAQRIHWVALPTPIFVAPAPLAVDWRPGYAPVDGRDREGGRALPSGDLVRSVRPYAAGDPVRLVHWPTTARTGDLVVRELEPPTPLGQVVLVDLTGLDERADEAAAYALGACLAVLDAGGVLVLCTAEETGPNADEVPSRLVARRRLAAAVAGPPGPVPEGWPLVEIGR